MTPQKGIAEEQIPAEGRNWKRRPSRLPTDPPLLLNITQHLHFSWFLCSSVCLLSVQEAASGAWVCVAPYPSALEPGDNHKVH